MKWNQRDVCFWNYYFSFEIQTSLVKDPTHYSMQSFDCLVFWKQKWPVVRFKNDFFMVPCVSFNLWSWVYPLMVYDEVTFCEFQKTRCSGFIKKGCFLAFILSACIITSSLIHEVTTLMEKLFKFWERHLSVQIACLIKKGF